MSLPRSTDWWSVRSWFRSITTPSNPFKRLRYLRDTPGWFTKPPIIDHLPGTLHCCMSVHHCKFNLISMGWWGGEVSNVHRFQRAKYFDNILLKNCWRNLISAVINASFILQPPEKNNIAKFENSKGFWQHFIKELLNIFNILQLYSSFIYSAPEEQYCNCWTSRSSFVYWYYY